MCRTVTVDVGNFEFMEIPQLDPGTTRVADVIQQLWSKHVNMHKKTLAKSDEDTPVSQPMIHKAILTFLYMYMHQLSTDDLISSLGTMSFKIVESHQEGIANWENLIYKLDCGEVHA